ncbi:MAG: HD domain-containing phosphohydrolase [Fibrobacterota bacterium]
MNETLTRESKLLIVDDEKSICDILVFYLRNKGYTVYQAGCGEEAIDILKKNSIDLVLSDIKMPGISGVDLLKWIKENRRQTPVLITTGFPTLDTAIEALKLGAFDYLTKPFHLEEIGEKIKRALTNRQLEEENLLFSRLVSLHEVTKVLSSTHAANELNHRFLDYSRKITRADGGSVMLCDYGNQLNVAISSQNYPDRFWKQNAFSRAAEWAIENHEPVAIDRNVNGLAAGLVPLPSGIESLLVFPLQTPKRTLGVLNLVRTSGRKPFSSVDFEIINVLASQASISIENTRLYYNIRDNYLKTVRGFALAVEAKDQYTHGHSENVMKYTVILAKHIGLTSKEMEQIKYAGLLHDIGKIGVAESILNKPGRLSLEEFEEIKKHPDLGARIISNVPFLKSLVPMIRHHHEFYDGKGYPDGIAGEAIPFGARILSVADAFEAMTSNRPYRKSMPLTTAYDILIKEKGKQFDPDIVSAFLEIMKKEPVK